MKPSPFACRLCRKMDRGWPWSTHRIPKATGRMKPSPEERCIRWKRARWRYWSPAGRDKSGWRSAVVNRKHSMPFGAEVREGGGVRFGLWAPKPARVDLLLDGATLPMERKNSGWFELIVAQARAGSRYQFSIDGQLNAPDPASRFQPEDVHGPSEVIDPTSFDWTDGEWKGRPWEEAVIYELHVGTFSPSGD